MNVVQSSHFKRRLKRLPKDIRRALLERLELFLKDHRHPLLNNHALTGGRHGQWSLNVTGDWRLIYQSVEPDIIRLLDIDTHHNLYGS